MKKLIRRLVAMLVLVLIILAVTCPNEADYNRWLSKEYGVTCVNTGTENKCSKSGKEIRFKSGHRTYAAIYMGVEQTYSEDNKDYQLRAVGILNTFFEY
ncbi:hypothetical protein PAEVO_31380 [Paenibacillus sp. GM2FR]|uniref:hypothetical protein n=1 Tax=Paenibacillus sp. GM2FR TaxID=2059268 RepID=UPI000CB46C45|nr:hypothetical protein [Paenibacillus sp. GM2FR]PJN56415.1 hypothetical protein PAEVO_31380 [Paenibacillus sp. GM2FR]